MSKSKPNILFAFADDWGRYASAYAPHEKAAGANHSLNELISTPNFDRIAVSFCGPDYAHGCAVIIVVL